MSIDDKFQVKTYSRNEVEVCVKNNGNDANTTAAMLVDGLQQALISIGIRSLAVRIIRSDDKGVSLSLSRTNKEDFDS